MAKKVKSKETVKEEMMREYRAAFDRKKEIVWRSDMNYQMIAPKCTIVRDNYVFRLRYTPNSDTCFEDDQPVGLPVRLSRIQIEDCVLITNPSEVALNMFMFFANGNKANGGNRYWLEDKEGDAAKELAKLELETEVVSQVMGLTLTDLRAAIYVLTGARTKDMQLSEARLKLVDSARKEPVYVKQVINDKHTILKYKFYLGQEKGLFHIYAEDTRVRWTDSDIDIFTNPKKISLDIRFAEACMEPGGSKIVELLDQKLNMV